MKMIGTKTAMTSTLALMLGTGGAMADVTPAEVWTDWKDYMTSFGFAVTAEEAQSGDDLSLTEIVMTQTLPDDAGTTTISVPSITLEDNGDGTVSIVYPADMPMTLAGTGDAPFSMEMIYRTTDLVSTVSGDSSQMTYEYEAASLGLTIGAMSVAGEAVELGAMTFDVADVAGETVMMLESGRTANQTVRTGPVTYTLAFTDPEDGASSIQMSGRIDNLDMTGNMVLPEGADMNNMAAALEAGFAIDGGYKFGPGSSDFSFTDEGATTTGKSASAGGDLSVKMDASGLSYGGTTNDLHMEATVPPLPFPVSADMKEASFNLSMPLTKDEEPQDFGLALTLADFAISDVIWAMFDPEAKLPREPANIALDLNGKARILADFMDPAQMAELEEGDGPAPAELNALTLNKLLVSLVGAELTGSGDVTFDNDATEAYGGMPTPVGDVALRLTGANTLLTTLADMGFLAPEQMMMARMGLGAIAVPGEGDDVFVSDIEFTEGGGLIANGQQLK